VIIYSVLELADENGKGINRFRLVGASDEDTNIMQPMCWCINGHASEKDAKNCPQALLNMKNIFSEKHMRGKK